MVELATGVFPYRDCKCDFEVLSRVLNDDPPSLPQDQEFTLEFRNFVSNWCVLNKPTYKYRSIFAIFLYIYFSLIKDYKLRPKYKQLLEHPFLQRYTWKTVNVAEWYAEVTNQNHLPKYFYDNLYLKCLYCIIYKF